MDEISGTYNVPGRRCWALEGTGSYGAGLAAFLETAGERVVEVCRPKRPAIRGGRKTDMLDAIRAAREAISPSTSSSLGGCYQPW